MGRVTPGYISRAGVIEQGPGQQSTTIKISGFKLTSAPSRLLHRSPLKEDGICNSGLKVTPFPSALMEMIFTSTRIERY